MSLSLRYTGGRGHSQVFFIFKKIASISSAGEGKEMLKAKNISIHCEVKCSTSKSEGLSEFHTSYKTNVPVKPL